MLEASVTRGHLCPSAHPSLASVIARSGSPLSCLSGFSAVFGSMCRSFGVVGYRGLSSPARGIDHSREDVDFHGPLEVGLGRGSRWRYHCPPLSSRCHVPRLTMVSPRLSLLLLPGACVGFAREVASVSPRMSLCYLLSRVAPPLSPRSAITGPHLSPHPFSSTTSPSSGFPTPCEAIRRPILLRRARRRHARGMLSNQFPRHYARACPVVPPPNPLGLHSQAGSSFLTRSVMSCCLSPRPPSASAPDFTPAIRSILPRRPPSRLLGALQSSGGSVVEARVLDLQWRRPCWIREIPAG